MAFQYGAWQAPQGYDPSPDIVGRFKQGFDFGQGIANEGDAKQALGDYVKALYMGGAKPQAANAATDPISTMVNGSVNAAQQATDPTLDSYFKSIAASESGGNDTAKNPNSSATGRYQFLDSTWNSLAQQHPDLGLTPDGRSDPAQQEKAIRALTMDNIGSLRQAGVPVTPGNLYAAHFLGAGGASNVLKQSDDTPLAQVLPPEVMQSNPNLANMTVGAFKQWTQQQGGNASGGYQAPLAPQEAQTPPTGSPAMANGLPPQEVMAALMRNPETRQFGAQLIQAAQSGDPANKPTDDMREYATAVAQGYRGTLLDYQKELKGGQTINVGGNNDIGTIPPGMMVQRDAQGNVTGMKPIPGGPAEKAAIDAAAQDQSGKDTRNTSAGIVVDDIDRALGQIADNPNFTTGLGSAAVGNIPTSPAYQVNSLIDTVKANAGFDRLQQMRDNSPTGGALGQVSEQENKLLQAAIGNLDTKQGRDQLEYNLKRVSNIYRDIIDGKGNGTRYDLNAKPGEDKTAKPTSQEDYDALPSGALFVDPDDGKTYRKP